LQPTANGLPPLGLPPGTTINVNSTTGLVQWKTLGDKPAATWLTEMYGKDLPGQKMLGDARALIAKHASSK